MANQAQEIADAVVEDLLQLLTTASVQVFGRRHDDAVHAPLRPASEKRQGTKSRAVGTDDAACAMGI